MRGHNIVADRWRGGQGSTIPIPFPPHARSHTQTITPVAVASKMRVFTLTDLIIDQRTNGRTKPLIVLELRVRKAATKNINEVSYDMSPCTFFYRNVTFRASLQCFEV